MVTAPVMKKILFIYVLYFYASSSLFSQNLVPNGDFELYTQLPTTYNQVNRLTNWNNLCMNYTTYPYGSPDFLNSNSFMLPYDYHPAASGNGSLGFLVFVDVFSDYREYTFTSLNAPMLPGTSYTIRFYLKMYSESGYACNHIGIDFSSIPLTQKFSEPLQIIPEIDITNIVNHTDYRPYIFTFTPTDTLNYITIGNFYNDQNTTISQLNYLGSGSYYMIDDILISKSGNVTVTGDTSVCNGNSITLTANGNSQFRWRIGTDTDVISVNKSITVSPNVATTYYVDNNLGLGSMRVTVLPKPVVNLGPDKTLCHNDSIILNASGTNYRSYLWQDGTIDSIFTVHATGIYKVKIQEGLCSAQDSIAIKFLNPYVSLGNDTTFCDGDDILLRASGNVKDNYLWQNGSLDSTLSVTSSGLYWVQVAEGNCISRDSINLIFYPIPIINIEKEITLCKGDTIVLNASGNPGRTFLWQDNSTDSIFSINKKGDYWVEVKEFNCVNRRYINVNQCCEYFIPNLITPNNDSVNEFFCLPCLDQYKWKIEIYNRWGDRIYENKDYKNDWGGYNVTEGIYYYFIENESKKVNGWIEVIK
jgi:gliding motility-associated-like protein